MTYIVLSQPAFFVTLFSVGNCIGRVLAAAGSDLVAERLPRPFALAVTAALFCVLFLLVRTGVLVFFVSMPAQDQAAGMCQQAYEYRID